MSDITVIEVVVRGEQGPAGDMDRSVYDPQSIHGDAFARANHTGTQAISTVSGLQSALDLKAPLASPALTGTPTVPTAAPGTNTTQAASTAFVSAATAVAVAALVASSPAALDTLNELAAALGNDANFATTVTNALALKAPLATPSFTGGLVTLLGSPSRLRLRDTAAPSTSYWDIVAADFYDQYSSGKHNHTWGLQFNETAALAGYPQWGENIEPYFRTAISGGVDLLEKNWSYTSIDRLTTYRPFGFSINLSTHVSEADWNVNIFYVTTTNNAVGSTATAYFNTSNQFAAFPGAALIGGWGTAASDGVLKVTGSTITHGTVLVSLAPTAVASNDIVVASSAPALTGTLVAYQHSSSATVLVDQILRNTGAGGARNFIWAGSGGDAWVGFATAVQNWCIGVDKSDSEAFVIANDAALGSTNRLRISTAGDAYISGSLNVGTAAVATTGRLAVVGATVGTIALSVAPTTAAANDIIIASTAPAITGSLAGIQHASSVSATLSSIMRNTGAGEVQVLAWAGSGGDAYFRALASTDWTFGNDRSDSGAFVLSNNPTLGSNNVLRITTAGDAAIASSLNVGSISPSAVGRLSVVGATVGTVGLNIGFTTAAAGDIIVSSSAPAITGGLTAVQHASSVSGTLSSIMRNTGAGETQVLAWAGSGGDAYFRALASTDWSFGNDRSDSGAFVLSNDSALGSNNALRIAPTTYLARFSGAISIAPGATVTPTTNGDVMFELTNNTTLTVKAKGSDGTVRSGTVTLA